MSVKKMTVEQIRNDLASIELTWPDALPWQQLDRVNALKSELKQRGEPTAAPAGALQPGTPTPIKSMSDSELEAELRSLSTRNDERSQERFADVRFELRRRSKSDKREEPIDERAQSPKSPKSPQVAPRALELPTDEEVARVTPRRLAPAGDVFAFKNLTDLKVKTPMSVRGYTAASSDKRDGSVVLTYENIQEKDSSWSTTVLSGDEADDFIGMMTRARQVASRRAADE